MLARGMWAGVLLDISEVSRGCAGNVDRNGRLAGRLKNDPPYRVVYFSNKQPRFNPAILRTYFPDPAVPTFAMAAPSFAKSDLFQKMACCCSEERTETIRCAQQLDDIARRQPKVRGI